MIEALYYFLLVYITWYLIIIINKQLLLLSYSFTIPGIGAIIINNGTK